MNEFYSRHETFPRLFMKIDMSIHCSIMKQYQTEKFVTGREIKALSILTICPSIKGVRTRMF